MMRKFQLRAEDAEIADWRAAAERDGARSLSEWLRDVANERVEMTVTCEAVSSSGIRCERGAGHDGFHTFGDDLSEEGLTAWSDDTAASHQIRDDLRISLGPVVTDEIEPPEEASELPGRAIDEGDIDTGLRCEICDEPVYAHSTMLLCSAQCPRNGAPVDNEPLTEGGDGASHAEELDPARRGDGSSAAPPSVSGHAGALLESEDLTDEQRRALAQSSVEVREHGDNVDWSTRTPERAGLGPVAPPPPQVDELPVPKPKTLVEFAREQGSPAGALTRETLGIPTLSKQCTNAQYHWKLRAGEHCQWCRGTA